MRAMNCGHEEPIRVFWGGAANDVLLQCQKQLHLNISCGHLARKWPKHRYRCCGVGWRRWWAVGGGGVLVVCGAFAAAAVAAAAAWLAGSIFDEPCLCLWCAWCFHRAASG